MVDWFVLPKITALTQSAIQFKHLNQDPCGVSGPYESSTYGSSVQSVPVAPLSCPLPVASASVAPFTS